MLALTLAGCSVASAPRHAPLVPSDVPTLRKPSVVAEFDAPFLDINNAGDASADVAPFPLPSGTRPCCAFGYDLQVSLGDLEVPGVTVGNLVDPALPGPHRYGGPAAIAGGSLGAAILSSEKNGLAYSCAGGFLDLAHIRDYADWTAYLFAAILPLVESGGVIPLHDEGGARFLVITPSDHAAAADARRDAAIAVAERIAWELSVWHEIATWYGWSSWSAFPEVASAFSPEDFYSNIVGIRLAGALLRHGRADDPEHFARSIDETLPAVFARFGAVAADRTRAALDAVDGRWWSSAEKLPNKDLLQRRSFDIGPTIAPWRVADVGPDDDVCPADASPVVLRVPDAEAAPELSARTTLFLGLADTLTEVVPLPHKGSRWVSSADLGELVRAARTEAQREYDMESDRP